MEDKQKVLESETMESINVELNEQLTVIATSKHYIDEPHEVLLGVNESSVNFTDPACWPTRIDENFRIFLVVKGPSVIEVGCIFPENECGRKFSSFHCERRLENGKYVIRKWLVYSKLKDRVFCFCCKLFGYCQKALESTGFNDWKTQVLV